jgi:LacI family transcriptional regulator
MDTCIVTNKNEYQKLAARLRSDIVNNRKAVAGQLVCTEQALTRDTGLSRKSVRRAVEVLVSEGIVERRPGKGIFMRSPHSTTLSVQVIIPEINFPLYAEIARGTYFFASKNRVQVQVYNAHTDTNQAIELVRKLPHTSMKGAIIASFHHHQFSEEICKLKMAGYPIVLVDEQLEDIEIPSVVSDNYAGGYAVGKELVCLGHRHIGFVGNLEARTVRQRLEGLRDAMNDVGLPFDRSIVKSMGWNPWDKMESVVGGLTREIMEQPDRPTAIFYSCDFIATIGYKTLAEMNIRIPNDVSIVGFDGDPVGRLMAPSLATIQQQATKIGEAAMELLLDQIINKTKGKAVSNKTSKVATILPIKFIHGESLGRVSKSSVK